MNRWTAATAARVRLTIDRLVLKGFGTGESAAMRTAFGAELHRQLAIAVAEGRLMRGVHISNIRGARVVAADAEAIGTGAARSVLNGIAR